jgi:signal transduction histidine kinase
MEASRLRPEVEIALFRIVQEALTNVAQHSHATQADVLLEKQEDRLVLIIEDNGSGFDPPSAGRPGRLGLVGMRERAEMLGGTLVVETKRGAGTSVFVEVPHVLAHSDR